MRWTLISFLCIVTINNVVGQKHIFENRIESKSPVNIGLNEVDKSFTPPSAAFQQLKSGIAKSSNINVTYVNFPEEAKPAFEYAISIWEQNITSSVPISVLATWEQLGSNILAKSRPAFFYANFDAALVPGIYYPIALVEKLSGREWNDSKEPDIICNFNNQSSWYFGTDGNTSVTKYDFVTVVLHEMVHGLGISGFITDDNGVGSLDNSVNAPSAYDYYIYNLQNQRISDNSVFKCPSTELHQQLTSDNLNFCSSSNGETAFSKIYAPSTWNDGGSIYHLKEVNELMTPYSYKGKSIHNPGETTLAVLSEIGWNSISFKLQEIKDFDVACAELPIQTKVLSDIQLNNSSMEIIFSTDYFATKDSASLTFNIEKNQFEGKLPLNNRLGKVQYFFRAKTTDNQIFTQPNQAPKNILNFKVGTDYYPPTIQHNPTTLISNINAVIDFSAIANDNVGINAVKVEYRINGTVQEPFQLTNNENTDVYNGSLHMPVQLSDDDIVEYRVFAEDNTSRKNKKYLPANGYYQVKVFESQEPVSGFSTDFNSYSNDFTAIDFDVTTPSGFSNGNLHTNNPYTQSELENEKYNLIAQLNYPIILAENGQMAFDEIVLVEPGDLGTSFTDELFWDYVIVEGSKDNGRTWSPVVDGYDSGINETWETQFSNSLKSSGSSGSGHENMFWKQTINLTENESFSAGDTVLFRFRLASDQSINGWGWAIDNLEIQDVKTGNDNFLTHENVGVYPNPFSNHLFVDCVNMTDQTSVEIMITDLMGKTVFHETRFDVQYNPKLEVDLSDVKSGIYMASITDSNYNTTTQKIIKK